MKDKILVIGGYGNVGKIICRLLAEYYPGKVIAAGRSYRKAQKFAEETQGKVVPLRLDLQETKNVTAHLGSQRLVISSIELDNNGALAEACLSEGTHYTEVGTSYETMQRVLALRSVASTAHSAIVSGTGLIPGLSNMLAKYLADQLTEVDHVNIHLMLGLGDTHGEDAIRWILSYANRTFKVRNGGKMVEVQTFRDPERVIFPDETKPRTTYRFDFADQHVVPKITGAQGASSRICFDSRLITYLLAQLSGTRLIKLVQILPPKLLVSLLHLTRIGSNTFALKVIAQGKNSEKESTLSASVRGSQEAYATGLVTAFVGHALYEGKVATGIHHVEEVLDFEEFFPWLEEHGLEINTN